MSSLSVLNKLSTLSGLSGDNLTWDSYILMIKEIQSEGIAPLLPPLKMFEVVVILKFLPASDKLVELSLLNKRWCELVHQHYAWRVFPTLPFTKDLPCYKRFLLSFSTLAGIRVPLQLNPIFLHKRVLDRLNTASSILLTTNRDLYQLAGIQPLRAMLKQFMEAPFIADKLEETPLVPDLIEGRDYKSLQIVSLFSERGVDLEAMAGFPQLRHLSL